MRVLIVAGTRPEAIKMAPVYEAAKGAAGIDVRFCATGQHRQMLDSVMSVFGITPDIDLDVMTPDQTLSSLTSAILDGMRGVFEREHFDWVLVQGDTTSAFAAALAAFYAKVKVGHVEAGLRTGDKTQPWPEETNRRLVAALADMHFAPTVAARDNLLREGIADRDIMVTGNTVIDALQGVARRIEVDATYQRTLRQRFPFLNSGKKLILVTGHRRENFGDGFRDICAALRALSARADLQIVYPVHLNPNVAGPVQAVLGGLDNVHLLEPLDYLTFVALMREAHFLLTDSGGIQEEAPGLGKPVLVMRNTSERMEAVEAGCARLVGTSVDTIVGEAVRLLEEPAHYARMSAAINPFGDGRAALKIISAIS